MPFNSVFGWFIKKRVHQIELFRKYPHEVQAELFQKLINNGLITEFGIKHRFDTIRTPEDFRKTVPITEYDDLKPYIDRLRQGEQNLLWPTRVKWFAKSSGTTSEKSKYIPVTKEALEDCHYKGGKDLLALYYDAYPDAHLYSGKNLVMGGSVEVHTYSKDSYTGDLSSIIIQNLPIWVELRRTPNKDIALMDNWEEKIERAARATMTEDVHMITGVPSWMLVLIKRICEINNVKDISSVWPNLQLFVHGGVSFKPYRSQFEKLIPNKGMHYLETYNASEGFFGIQDSLESDDLLLMLDYGIYYEFMPMEELGKDDPETIGLADVEVGKNYALIISTNAGLWRHMIGDTVRFTSVNPYKIRVSGRTKLFINAFGEELIIDNAEEAVKRASVMTGAQIADFTACPVYMTASSQGAHEWLFEFDRPPADIEAFTDALDISLKEVNTDYATKRSFDLSLQRPLVRVLPKGSFYNWMRSKNKLGGQNKVPRLANDRVYVEEILNSLVVHK